MTDEIRKKKMFKKECFICKKEFNSIFDRTLTCSISCKKKYSKIRDAAYFKKHYKTTMYKERQCLVCKKIFIPVGYKKGLKKLCSKKCEKERELYGNKKWQKKSNYYIVNKKILNKKSLERYHLNRENNCKKRRISYQKNKKKILKKAKIYYKLRKKEDINYRIRKMLRDRINSAIGKNYKQSLALELLGCSIYKVKQYLEQQFKEGMNWKNHGIYGWHIDHIIPCCRFDLTKLDEQKKCFHYTNLQPLWANENLSKNRF